MVRKIYITRILLAAAIVFLTSIVSSFPANLFAQSNVIHGNEYRLKSGKWYTYSRGEFGAELDTSRLVVRLKNRGPMERFDFTNLGLTGITLASPRYLGGFYVLSLPVQQKVFEIAKRLETTNLFDDIHFDLIGQISGQPDDTFYGNQWNLTKILMEQAWDITTGSSNVTIAVIDMDLPGIMKT